MRVLHLVCSTGFAGVERYIVHVATGLSRAGDDVTVIGGDPESMRAALDPHGVAWMPGGDMREAWQSLRATTNPDILHTHMSQADLVGWMHRRARRRVRQVSTRHFAGRRGSSRIARPVFTRVAASLDAQIAISDYVAQYVEEPVDVVHTGVDVVETRAPRERWVLAAQRLEPEKNTADVIEAWAVSRGPSAGWALRIAGDGALRPDLERLARERGVAGSVEFLGHRTDVPALLVRAGAVIAPTPREGLGLFVLEAMAAGAPVIASGGGGHLETVGAATPDLLFTPGDTADAARILDLLIEDDGLRAHRGTVQQSVQRERFTVEQQVAQTRAVYERILSDPVR